MNWIKDWWSKYKTKSVWSKVTDGFYLIFFITVITPQGRTALQRGLLELGLFSSTELTEKTPLSAASLNWQLTDLNGNSILLSQLNDKVIFLNFWSTWCGPCTAEMPNILKLMKRMNGNVAFVFAAHESAATVANYMKKQEWEMPAYIYQANPGTELFAGSLPSTFIIDKNGNVVHRSSGMKKWNTQETVDLLNRLAE